VKARWLECLCAFLFLELLVFGGLIYFMNMNEDGFLDGLNESGVVDADFVGRVPGVEVDRDREMTVKRLTPRHREVVKGMGYGWDWCWRAEQVHGGDAGVVAGVDGLVTADPGVLLGIYVADCGAVYLCDPVLKVIGLVHSGKKGTEANIVGRAIEVMRGEFGCDPARMVGALAPCIRPPRYEVNFAAEICKQAELAGISKESFVDCGGCIIVIGWRRVLQGG